MHKEQGYNVRIGVIGLGYIGLPVLHLFSTKFESCGLDRDYLRIRELNNRVDSKGELSSSELNNLLLRCKISNSWDAISDCNFYIITVPTPITEKNIPDTSALEDVCSSLSQIISRGDIIVFESTVYPGATEELCIPILEKGSNLSSNSDFFVGYSPERVNVGDKEHGLSNTPKIVSAQNNETLDVIYNVYNKVFNAGIIKASSIKTAEAAKMYENVQRDVLIALANQYSEYCKTEGLNIKEVTECASTKWNFSKVYPGLVGGHCISVDPYYLLDRAKAKSTELQLIEEARHINEYKTACVAKRIIDFANAFFPNRDSLNVLVLGFSYKKNVGDIRNTKIAELIGILSKSIGRVDCYDPLVVPQEVNKTYGVNIIISQENISNKDYDIAIIAVKHNCIRDLQYKAKKTIDLEDFV